MSGIFFRMMWTIIGSPVVLICMVLVGIATTYAYLHLFGVLK